MNEAELKSAVADYLTYAQNQGKLVFLRLNSGDFIVTNEGGTFRRRIKGCPKGTADFLIIRAIYYQPKPSNIIPKTKTCRVIFLELKSEKGKTSPEQNAFKVLVEAQGCSYFIVRSIEELETILGDKE